jgi:hypothetical protein
VITLSSAAKNRPYGKSRTSARRAPSSETDASALMLEEVPVPDWHRQIAEQRAAELAETQRNRARGSRRLHCRQIRPDSPIQHDCVRSGPFGPRTKPGYLHPSPCQNAIGCPILSSTDRRWRERAGDESARNQFFPKNNVVKGSSAARSVQLSGISHWRPFCR